MKPLFSESLDITKARPLDHSESMLMAKVLLADRMELLKPTKAEFLFSVSEVPIPTIYQIMLGRLKLTDLEYNEGTIILLADLADGNPGRAVMIAHALFTVTRERGECVDPTTFAREVCPWGYPTDEYFHEVWQSQKVGGANYLDTKEAWQ